MCLRHPIPNRYEKPAFTDDELDKIHTYDKLFLSSENEEYEYPEELNTDFPLITCIYHSFTLENAKKLLTDEHVAVLKKNCRQSSVYTLLYNWKIACNDVYLPRVLGFGNPRIY